MDYFYKFDSKFEKELCRIASASDDLPPPQEPEARLGEQLWLFHHDEVPHLLRDAAFGQTVRDRGNRVHHRLFGDVIIRLPLEQEDRAFDLVQMLAHIVSERRRKLPLPAVFVVFFQL